MTQLKAWPGVPVSVSAADAADTSDTRAAFAGLVETDAAGNVRAGIFPTNLNPIVTARADMNVDIAAFNACAVQFGGPIFFQNNGVVQLPSVLVSPASGTNYYVVYTKQNESSRGGTDANNNRVMGTVLSTSSFVLARSGGTRMDASGTGLPTGAVELATVQMPASKTATNASGVTITPTFQYTAADGGVVFVRNSTELGLWTPSDGSLAYQIDTGTMYQRVNGAWGRVTGLAGVGTPLQGSAPPANAVFLEQAGVATVSVNASGDGSIVFPTAFPAGVMAVVLTRFDFSVYGATIEVLNTTQSLSQVNFRVYQTGGSVLASVTVKYAWRAVGW